MRFIKPVSRRIVMATTVLGLVAVLGLAPWTFVPESSAGEKVEKKAEQKDKVAPKHSTVTGWFHSFEDGILAIKYRNGMVSTKIKIPDNAKAFVWNHNEARYQPVETAEAMSQLKTLTATIDAASADTAETLMWRKAGVGLVVQIADENVTIRIGEKKTPFIGKFVSFKSDVLLFRLTDRTGPYRSLYGNPLHFKMREDIPVYESIDGGEYKWIGTPRSALGNVKEGANITIYHHYKTEDDEFYLILVGVKKVEQKVEKKEKGAQKEKIERGRFMSFKDGTLTIQANSGALLVNKLPENTKILVWNYDEGAFKPADTADTLNRTKAGTWFVVRVASENATIRIGARKGETIGNFVSFKDDRLLILGKNLGESYVKKYGDNVHFNKFRNDVPIYESVDGGEYELAKGALRTILANLKEGMVVTVHGEGDDNITRIDIGVAKKK